MEKRAASVVASIRGRLDAIRAESQSGPKPTVLLIVGRDPGMLSNLVGVGPGAYLDELIAIAGGRNMLADSKVQYPHISMETVLRADPDDSRTPAPWAPRRMTAPRAKRSSSSRGWRTVH